MITSKVALEDRGFVENVRRARLPAPVQEAFAAFIRKKQAQSAAERASEHLWWRTQLRLMGRMAATGASFLAGTDAACEGGLPGFSLHDELALLVDTGLSPAAALRAATWEPARYLAATDSMGNVTAGMLADLVLLDAKPLEDIPNPRRVRAVIVNGRLLDRAAIDAVLDRVRRAAQEQP